MTARKHLLSIQLNMPAKYAAYQHYKVINNDAIVFVPNGDKYEAYGDDARYLNEMFGKAITIVAFVHDGIFDSVIACQINGYELSMLIEYFNLIHRQVIVARRDS